MNDFKYAFERLGEPDPDKRIVFLTLDEFDVFFSGEHPRVAQKALAWSEFRHSVGGRMIKTDLQCALNTQTPPPQKERNREPDI